MEIVSKYGKAILPHLGWFREQIALSKDDIIRVSIKNIRLEMGSEFADIHDTTIYSRLRDILLENGIKVVMGHLENKDKLLVMSKAKKNEIASAADTRYLRAIKTAEKQGLTFAEYDKKLDHNTYGSLPQEENIDCPLYFGQYIEEKYVSQIFEDPVPFTFPIDELGRITDTRKPYDFLCKQGFKIKHVASCLRTRKSDNKEIDVGSDRKYWGWLIRRNPIPDYWMISGWDNRESLEPLFVWMIKGHEEFLTQMMYDKGHQFYDRDSFTIYFNEKGIKKMKKYEVTDKLDQLKDVCRLAREE